MPLFFLKTIDFLKKSWVWCKTHWKFVVGFFTPVILFLLFRKKTDVSKVLEKIKEDHKKEIKIINQAREKEVAEKQEAVEEEILRQPGTFNNNIGSVNLPPYDINSKGTAYQLRDKNYLNTDYFIDDTVNESDPGFSTIFNKSYSRIASSYTYPYTTDNYGYSIVNEESGGSDRGLRFKRHENNASGVDVLKRRRDNGTVEFPIANQIISGSATSTGSFGRIEASKFAVTTLESTTVVSTTVSSSNVSVTGDIVTTGGDIYS